MLELDVFQLACLGTSVKEDCMIAERYPRSGTPVTLMPSLDRSQVVGMLRLALTHGCRRLIRNLGHVDDVGGYSSLPLHR